MNKIKVAVIGTGGISNNHIRGYLGNPQVELYALCDINEERVKSMGELYGVSRLYTDKDVMLRELPELDAVSVCTWNSEHVPCTIAALNAGCHVLCEKPMATSAAEAKEMKEAADRNGKLLMVGFVRRFENKTAVLTDYIKNDYFGDIYYGRATYLRRNGSPGGWFGDKSRSAGGPLIDLGVHIIDLTRYLCGNPKPISVYGTAFHKLANRPNVKTGGEGYTSVGKSNQDIFDVEDLATAMIRYDNGLVISLETSFSLNMGEKEMRQVELFGTKAGARLEPEPELYTDLNGYLSNIQLAASTGMTFDAMFQNEINHYVDCITNQVSCKSPAEDGIVIMQILDAIYESARTGHEVIL